MTPANDHNSTNLDVTIGDAIFLAEAHCAALLALEAYQNSPRGVGPRSLILQQTESHTGCQAQRWHNYVVETDPEG